MKLNSYSITFLTLLFFTTILPVTLSAIRYKSKVQSSGIKKKEVAIEKLNKKLNTLSYQIAYYTSPNVLKNDNSQLSSPQSNQIKWVSEKQTFSAKLAKR